MTVPGSASAEYCAKRDTRAQMAALVAAVLHRCDALAALTDDEGKIQRTFLSPAMEHCNALTGKWMEQAGMQVRLDTAGNLRGMYEGETAEAPVLIVASHLDTVPDAGRYDGILGVLIGIALVESLGGRRLPFAIEVIGFSDEEGVRFGLPFIGSRAAAGTLPSTDHQRLDANGVTLDAALEGFADGHPSASGAALSSRSCAYLEFHIEQGPVLDKARQSLAAVEAIAGQSRATFTFHGHAGHAGTTPMALRRDAMTAAAEWLLQVEAIAGSTPDSVATTGRVACEPGATNIIPGIVHCSLDVRSPHDSLRRALLQQMIRSAEMIGAQRSITVSQVIEVDQDTVRLDQSLMQLVQQSISASGEPFAGMVSGAGHDAMIIAPHLPTAMIFLRSPGGLSHHPDESVRVEDVLAALEAGARLLDDFPTWLRKHKVGL